MTHEKFLSILCVDDDPDVRDLFKKILSREPGFTVETSPSAEDALELLRVRHFDAIVADFAMPGMDGIALLKEVRARGLNSVFTIVTGKRLSHIAIDALNNGADFYIHKGPDTAKDMGKLSEFIRTHAVMKKDDSTHGEWERFYASCIEGSTDVICRIQPEGTFSFANEYAVRFFKRPHDKLLNSLFFVFIPENERPEVLARLHGLTPERPEVLLEHHIITGDGDAPLLQWKYQGIFSSGKRASEFLVSGRETEGLVRIGSTVMARPVIPAASRPVIVTPRPAPRSAPAAEQGSDDWKSLVEAVNSLEYPVFAVNRAGTVIAWNRALGDLTGVTSETIVGKGNHEYAVPFYGKPTLMLIDHIITPASPVAGVLPGFKKVGDTFIGDVEHVWIKENPMLLWGKGTAVHNAKGELIAAVEAVTVGELDKGATTGTQENYIGGLTSLTLKVSGDGMSGAIAGAIGSSTGGYGVYVTSLRLFIIQNPDLDASTLQGVQFGTFIMDELFGTTVDTRPRSIQDLEKSPVFMAEKENIMRIDLKKPVLLSGHMTVTVRNGGSFRIYIDHKKAFSHLEKILKDFYPEVIWEE